MGSTCSARVEECPSSRAARSRALPKQGSRSQAGGDRGILLMRKKTHKNGALDHPKQTAAGEDARATLITTQPHFSPLKKMDDKQNHRRPERHQQSSSQSAGGMRDYADHPGNDGRTDRRERE